VPEMLGEMVESCAPLGCRACSVRSPCTCQMLGLIVLSSTLALPFHIALEFFCASATLLQGAYSHTEKHTRGQRMRQKISNREGSASSVFVLCPLSGAPCFREIDRIAWCAQVSLQSVRHRSFWHPQPATTHVESCDEQVGMRAPGSEPGRRGVSRSTLANRVHAATVLGERSNS